MNIERRREFILTNDSDIPIDMAYMERHSFIKCTYILKTVSEFPVLTPSSKLFLTSLTISLN